MKFLWRTQDKSKKNSSRAIMPFPEHPQVTTEDETRDTRDGGLARRRFWKGHDSNRLLGSRKDLVRPFLIVLLLVFTFFSVFTLRSFANDSADIDLTTGGAITITKLDADTGAALSGAVFEIKNGGTIVRTVTTGPDGTVTVAGLSAGDYEVSEKTPPTGYEKSNGTQQVTISSSATWYNPTLRGKITGSRSGGTYAGYDMVGSEGGSVKAYCLDQTGDNPVVYARNVSGGTYYASSSERGQQLFDSYISKREEIYSIYSGRAYRQFNLYNSDETKKAKRAETLDMLRHVLYAIASNKIGGNQQNLIWNIVHRDMETGLFTQTADYATAMALTVPDSFQPEILTPDNYYFSGGNVDGGLFYQPLITVPVYGALYNHANLTFENTLSEEYSSNFTIHKIDRDTENPVSGATFSIVGDDTNLTKTTDADGNIYLKLPAGEYTITETQAPEGYMLDITPRTVQVGRNGTYDTSDVPQSNLSVTTKNNRLIVSGKSASSETLEYPVYSMYDGLDPTTGSYSKQAWADWIWSTWPTPISNYATTYTDKSYVTDPTEYATIMEFAIIGGYPNDASHIQKRYNLSDDDYYRVTQLALWAYLHQDADTYRPQSPSANAFNDLLNFLDLYNKDGGYAVLQEFAGGSVWTERNNIPLYYSSLDQPLLVGAIPLNKQGAEITLYNSKIPSLFTTVSAKLDDIEATGTKAKEATLESTSESMAVSVQDTISYSNLSKKTDYNITARLMKIDGETATEIKKVEAPRTTSDNGSGTWTIDFGTVTLDHDSKYVVFEKAVNADDGKDVVTHEEKDDKAQTIITTEYIQPKTYISLTKQVRGNGADTNRCFVIQFGFKDSPELPFEATISTDSTCGNPTKIYATGESFVELKLRHGDTITIGKASDGSYEIPVGTQYDLWEEDLSDYSVQYFAGISSTSLLDDNLRESNAVAADSEDFDAENRTTVINIKNLPTPTGLDMRATPYAILFAGVALFLMIRLLLVRLMML